jgi:hypothetical protein
MLMSAVKTKNSAHAKWRLIVAWAAAVCVVVGISVGAWAMWRAHAREKLLASIKDDPRKVREAVEQGQISREDARETMMEAFESRMNKTMDDYFALQPKDREKYLDKLIDEQEAMRRQWQQRATTRPATRPAREDRPTSRPAGDWQRRAGERADRTPPERQAKRAEFMAAMMQRRMERGLSNGGGFGGRGGWGGGGRGGGGRGAGGGGNR